MTANFGSFHPGSAQESDENIIQTQTLMKADLWAAAALMDGFLDVK